MRAQQSLNQPFESQLLHQQVPSLKAGFVFIYFSCLLANITFLLIFINFDPLVREVNRKFGVTGQNPGFPRHSVPLYFNLHRVHRWIERG